MAKFAPDNALEAKDESEPLTIFSPCRNLRFELEKVCELKLNIDLYTFIARFWSGLR